MTATLQPSAAMISAFNNVDIKSVDARTGAAPWTPPAGHDYILGLNKVEFDPTGMQWEKDGNKFSKPTIQFFWTCLDGEFSGKEFRDERFVIDSSTTKQDGTPLSDGALKARARDLGRLKGILQVVTGEDVLDVPVSLMKAMAAIEGSGGSFAIVADVSKYTPKPYVNSKGEAVKPYEQTTVFAKSAYVAAS